MIQKSQEKSSSFIIKKSDSILRLQSSYRKRNLSGFQYTCTVSPPSNKQIININQKIVNDYSQKTQNKK